MRVFSIYLREQRRVGEMIWGEFRLRPRNGNFSAEDIRGAHFKSALRYRIGLRTLIPLLSCFESYMIRHIPLWTSAGHCRAKVFSCYLGLECGANGMEMPYESSVGNLVFVCPWPSTLPEQYARLAGIDCVKTLPDAERSM